MIADRDTLSEEEFAYKYDGWFFETDFKGDGTVVELCDHGTERPITSDNVDEFVNLYLYKYTELDSLQFKQVYLGF